MSFLSHEVDDYNKGAGDHARAQQENRVHCSFQAVSDAFAAC
jgi:hypothetical protein